MLALVKGTVGMTTWAEFIAEERGAWTVDWPVILLILGLFLTTVASMSSTTGAKFAGEGATFTFGFGAITDRLPQVGPLHR